MPDAFYEIIAPIDGRVLQRLAVLTVAEREQLEHRGYQVVRRTLDRTLWRWLLDDDGDDLPHYIPRPPDEGPVR